MMHYCCAPPPPVQGFITADEVLSIPELSINPLAKRLAGMYDSINFREFLVGRPRHAFPMSATQQLQTVVVAGQQALAALNGVPWFLAVRAGSACPLQPRRQSRGQAALHVQCL
jgi:hypothetical protein